MPGLCMKSCLEGSGETDISQIVLAFLTIEKKKFSIYNNYMIHDENGEWHFLNIDDYLNTRSVDYDKHRYFLKQKALETLSKPKLSKKLMDVLRKKGISPGEINRDK